MGKKKRRNRLAQTSLNLGNEVSGVAKASHVEELSNPIQAAPGENRGLKNSQAESVGDTGSNSSNREPRGAMSVKPTESREENSRSERAQEQVFDTASFIRKDSSKSESPTIRQGSVSADLAEHSDGLSGEAQSAAIEQLEADSSGNQADISRAALDDNDITADGLERISAYEDLLDGNEDLVSNSDLDSNDANSGIELAGNSPELAKKPDHLEKNGKNTGSSISTISDEGRDYAVEPIGARIKVIGIGGGGSNAVNNMIRSGLNGVEFITANTDIQSLRSSLADAKLQLGKDCTKGLGAGANPEVGETAARESADEIRDMLTGADMVFITAGMGGGSGTGGASIVAQIAKEMGALTVGVVTKPFLFEGKRRMLNADVGIQNLKREVDTLITIPNQRLLSIAGRNTTLLDCFRRADDVLFQAVKGISDLILFEGLVNVDFADVKAVMSEMGMAMMGSGEGEGENRAVEAAEKAISSPLLEDISIHGARGILINVTAGPDVTLQEINEAAELIHQEAHDEANIIWGMVIDQDMKDKVRVTVIATGFGDEDRRMMSMSAPSMSNAPQLDSSGYDKKLDIPTFSRNKMKEPAPSAVSSSSDTLKLKKISVVAPSEEEDKYEIPTFLRRQVD